MESGSIQIKDENERAIAALAQVTGSEAAQIATRAVQGKVVQCQLDEESGYLVWEIALLSPDGQETQL